MVFPTAVELLASIVPVFASSVLVLVGPAEEGVDEELELEEPDEEDDDEDDEDDEEEEDVDAEDEETGLDTSLSADTNRIQMSCLAKLSLFTDEFIHISEL